MQASRPVCLEMYSQYPQMGRFTLRSNDKTIAMGRVERLSSKSSSNTNNNNASSSAQQNNSDSNPSSSNSNAAN